MCSWIHINIHGKDPVFLNVLEIWILILKFYASEVIGISPNYIYSSRSSNSAFYLASLVYILFPICPKDIYVNVKELINKLLIFKTLSVGEIGSMLLMCA